jgi:uncharacterized protein YaiL (DUF2058 family)
MSTPTINMSVEKQLELLAKLQAEKARQSERAKEYRERNKEKCNAWSERARIRATIMVKKAKEMGITVDDDEIDEYIANMK